MRVLLALGLVVLLAQTSPESRLLTQLGFPVLFSALMASLFTR